VETPAAQGLRQRLEKGGVLSCPGVAPAAQPFFAALLHYLLPSRPIVVITAGLRIQESFHQDLQTWLSSTISPQLLFYPSWEILPHEDKLPHADVISERLETLVALAPQRNHAAPRTDHPLVVTSVIALLQRTFARSALMPRLRTVTRGDQLDPLDLIEWLEDQAYEPEAQVTQKGELALRGGIVDVFPLTSPWPVRLEFFGNQLESLRCFDPQTQISREEISRITLPPAGELGLMKRMVRAASGPPADTSTLLDYLPRETLLCLCQPPALDAAANEYLKHVPAGDPFFVRWEELRDQIRGGDLTVLEVDEWPGLPRRTVPPAHNGQPQANAPAGGTRWLGEEAFGAGAGAAPPTAGPPLENAEPGGLDSEATLLGPRLESLDAFRPLAERPPELQVAEAQRREFFAQLHRWLRQGYAVHVFCNNEGEQQRFHEVWAECGYGLAPQATQMPSCPSPGSAGAQAAAALAAESSAPQAQSQAAGPRLAVGLGALARGFFCDEAKLVVVTDAEIFGRYKVQRPRRLKSPHALAAGSLLDINFSDLEPGDYVVHLNHGIGRYLGLQRLPPSPSRKAGQATAAPAGASQECLLIEYAPRAPDLPAPRLYVPVTEAHLVSKYVGAGKAHPLLNTLGGARWARARAQAAEAVRDLAAELLSVQAARAAQAGFGFGPDPPWQREFEGGFLYEETPDQLRAIADTKADMERPKPMDRLICGDAGFGKTEVAIRAAFKAVLGGKQAAVLVPTTVLAQQHFNTFRERMADYPVRVELLSRFRSRREQERVLEGLAAGAVDIVIGTHRLIQSDVQFKELGLVIIDEEQRFGVLHKERLKQLRQLVDVLTLSATPIPRTLYLALMGARDMSSIETPPQDRLPIQTIIAAYDEGLIRDAIQRELNRGGQVFCLHNRVLDIENVAQRLRLLVPQARLEVSHGQMRADDLEEVMARFVNGQADILLSTTIIESGIDIPNANTIIIDRADRFGLSDLYQLRGRVGRYKHQAYAYLLLPRHAGLLADARKRICAIRQFSTPGSGYKIAMRDLEIRGAGNLLGPEQSGHITAVGFDLYCQLLKQSIGGLKGQTVRPPLEVKVRLDFLSAPAAAYKPSAGPQPDSTLMPGSQAEAEASATKAEAIRPPPPTAAKRAAPSRKSKIKTQKSLAACLPESYIPEPQHRLGIYRKLAQAADPAALDALRAEMRDRFGPWPVAVELLLQVTDLKRVAGERGVSAIETRGDKLMLTRQGDFLMVGDRFPRLRRKSPLGRLKEIRSFLVSSLKMDILIIGS
jgi:transcription-repair coupling factor (superfamily II helicase)